MVTANKLSGLGLSKGFSVVLSIFLVTSCSTTISGNLRSFDDQPIYSSEARVNVVSLTQDSSEPQILEVEKDGSFETTDSITPGHYMVEALVPGYKPMSVKLDIKKSEKILLKLSPTKKIKTNSFKYYEKLDESRGQGGAKLVPPMIY